MDKRRLFKPKVPKNKEANISTDADGTYRVDVRLRRSNGELFRKQVRDLTTKTDARNRRDEFYEEFNILEGGDAYANRLIVTSDEGEKARTLRSWCDECVEIHWPRTVPATVKDYAQVVRDHIKPAIGDVPIDELTSRRITDWVYVLRDKTVVLNPKSENPREIKLSVSSLKAIKAALSSALSLAVDQGIIESNPALRLKIKWSVISEDRRRERQVRGEPEDMPDKRLLSKKEVDQLLAKSQGSPIYPTILLQAKCGLRIAEALAVRGRDIDLKAGMLRIRRQLKWVAVDGKDQLMLVDLKTKSSRRDIPLPRSVRDFAKTTTDADKPLTTNEVGTWLDPRKAQTLIRDAFRSAGLCGVPVTFPPKTDPTSMLASYLDQERKHEAKTVYGGADRSDSARDRRGCERRGDVPQARGDAGDGRPLA